MVLRRIFNVFIVLVLIAALGTGAWATWHATHKVQMDLNALESALYIGYAEDGGTIAYHQSKGTFTPATVSLKAAALALAPAALAQVVETPNGQWVVEVNGTPVVTSSTTKAHVAISADGAWVAYDESSTAPAPTFPIVTDPPLPASDPGWQVVLVRVKDHAATTLGTGVAPAFVGSDHLVWLTSNGVRLHDVKSGDESVIAGAPGAVSPLLVSPDQSYIGYVDSAKRQFQAYRFVGAGLVSIGAFGIQKNAMGYALGDDALYLTQVSSQNGTTVWRQGFDGSAAAQTLQIPVQFRITRLILPS